MALACGVRTARHGDLELAHHLIGDLFLVDSLGRGDRLLQAAALVHGGGGNDAGLIGQSAQMLDFSLGKGMGVLIISTVRE